MHAATTAAAAASQNSRRRDSITKFRQAVAPGESPPGGRDAAETRDAFLAATPRSHNATPQLSRPLRPSPPSTAPLTSTAAPPGGWSAAAKFVDDGEREMRQALREAEVLGAVTDVKNQDSVCSGAAHPLERLMSLDQAHALTITVQARKEHEKEEMRQHFAAQTDIYRQRIRKLERGTIHPHSRFAQRWDLITILAILYTATVTPFEVGFLPDGIWALFGINRAVDLVFAIDIGINFFMAYRERPDRGGQWIFDNHKIIRRYLRGWFAIDVITTMPIDAILVVLEASGAITIDGGDTQFTRLVRMLRRTSTRSWTGTRSRERRCASPRSVWRSSAASSRWRSG